MPDHLCEKVRRYIALVEISPSPPPSCGLLPAVPTVSGCPNAVRPQPTMVGSEEGLQDDVVAETAKAPSNANAQDMSTHSIQWLKEHSLTG